MPNCLILLNQFSVVALRKLISIFKLTLSLLLVHHLSSRVILGLNSLILININKLVLVYLTFVRQVLAVSRVLET